MYLIMKIDNDVQATALKSLTTFYLTGVFQGGIFGIAATFTPKHIQVLHSLSFRNALMFIIICFSCNLLDVRAQRTRVITKLYEISEFSHMKDVNLHSLLDSHNHNVSVL